MLLPSGYTVRDLNKPIGLSPELTIKVKKTRNNDYVMMSSNLNHNLFHMPDTLIQCLNFKVEKYIRSLGDASIKNFVRGIVLQAEFCLTIYP